MLILLNYKSIVIDHATQRSCVAKFDKRKLNEIAKIETLEYRAITKHLYLNGLRGKHFYQDIPSTLGEQYLSYATVKLRISNFERVNFPLTVMTDTLMKASAAMVHLETGYQLKPSLFVISINFINSSAPQT